MNSKTKPIPEGTCNVPINMDVDLRQALDFILKINGFKVRNAILKAFVESFVTGEAVMVEGRKVSVNFAVPTQGGNCLLVRSSGDVWESPAAMPVEEREAA
jgi:hypothetical protein